MCARPLLLLLLASGAAAQVADPDAWPPVHGPLVVWRGDPSTSAEVVWIERTQPADPDPAAAPSPAPVERLAWIRPPGGAGWRGVVASQAPFGSTANRVRRARIAGLEPGTRYELALGELPPARAAATFETAPDDPAVALRFVAGGDMYHRRDHLDAMNARAGALAPTFALLGGDLAYANGTQDERWYEWVDSWVEHARAADGRLIPMVVAIGNHEVGGGGALPHERARHYYPLFASEHGLPFFTLDLGQRLSIFVLDSGHTWPVAGAQSAWLAEALARRAGRRHLFAIYHRPAYGTAKGPATDVREHWVPLFERHGLDVAFENDHHTYKRTHPLIGGEPAAGGVLYLGDGAWGVGLRGVPEPGTVAYLAHAESRRHLILTTLEGGRRRHEAIDAEGVVFDVWPER